MNIFGLSMLRLWQAIWGLELSFLGVKACGDLKFFGKKDAITITQRIANMENAPWTSFCLKESKVRFASFLMRDKPVTGGRTLVTP